MVDTTLVIIIAVALAFIFVVIALGLCLCKSYGVFGGKSDHAELYRDHIPLEFKKSLFSSSQEIKTGTHFQIMIGTKPKHRLELSHIDSDTVLMLQMKPDISTVTKDLYITGLDRLRKLEKHDHVITLYGTYDTETGPCTVLEFAQFGTLKYYLSYSSYKTFYDYRGFNDDDDTFDNMRPPESMNSLQRKRNLFAYPKIVMESRKTPLSALTLYYLMWQICLGMEFLHQNDQVHGSLCSFNIFVTGHLTLKINCFSLAFEDKYALNAIPRWIAPEVFMSKTLTKEADVWSYGVTMWELFNCGAIPYNHLTVEEVIEKTRIGQYVLTPPPGDSNISRLFTECFNLYPHNRPSFSEIRLVLEKLLSSSEVALTNKFLDSRVLQYATTTLLDKIFYDQHEVDVVLPQHIQRPLYFTLPTLPHADMMARSGSMTRIPITLSGDPHNDVTYADPVDYQNGRDTGETMDLLSTSSAEFEDISSSESLQSEGDVGYNNLDPLTLRTAAAARPIARMRRISSLNDLVNFRRHLEQRTPDRVLERPQSVVMNKDLRRYSSDEYEDADEISKKRHHNSLRKFGSALHASFRRIRHKARDESGYETLPDKHDWEKRSFRNLLRGSKKWKQAKCDSNPKIRTAETLGPRRKVSQSETCLNVVQMKMYPLHHTPSIPIDQGYRTVSVSSGVSIPISVYSDYEIPDEILEASMHQEESFLQAEPNRGSQYLDPSEPSITKSRSANQIVDLMDRSPDLLRKRANSHNGPKLNYTQSLSMKHNSCIYDYKSSPKPSKPKQSSFLSRSFSRKQGKSISDILGSPPAVPNDRRPSILCTCCNSIHVCQTLPGMSLTPSVPKSSATSPTGRSPTYENFKPSPAECPYESLPSGRQSDSDSESDYEDLDLLTSLTQVTEGTVTSLSGGTPPGLTSPGEVTLTIES